MAMAGSTYRSGVFLVLLAGSIWSTTGLTIRLIEEAQTWQILFYRSIAMTPVLFLFITYRSKNRLIEHVRKAGIPAAIGAMGLVFAFAGGIFAIQSTTVANAVFLFGLGLSIYTFGSKVVPAAELALLSTTEVLLGPVWVWVFIGEIASLWTSVGGAILMVAIAENALSGIRRHPPKIWIL
jgi:drug/metabolite transporter (DMT)-like permease